MNITGTSAVSQPVQTVGGEHEYQAVVDEAGRLAVAEKGIEANDPRLVDLTETNRLLGEIRDLLSMLVS